MKSVFPLLRWRFGLAAPLLLIAGTAHAADPVLQVVDLSEKGMSSEGGEAKLFRLTNSRLGACKIEVVHFGEMGRTTLRFLFDRQLRFAARREYSYSGHIASTPDPVMTLRSEANLSSPGAAGELRLAYAEYRAMFDPAKLSRCERARPRG